MTLVLIIPTCYIKQLNMFVITGGQRLNEKLPVGQVFWLVIPIDKKYSYRYVVN